MVTAKNVVISGILLDHQGYRTSPEITRFEACVFSNGHLYEGIYFPFERVTLDCESNLIVCGGTFIPDEGQLDRLSRDYGCAL